MSNLGGERDCLVHQLSFLGSSSCTNCHLRPESYSCGNRIWGEWCLCNYLLAERCIETCDNYLKLNKSYSLFLSILRSCPQVLLLFVSYEGILWITINMFSSFSLSIPAAIFWSTTGPWNQKLLGHLNVPGRKMQRDQDLWCLGWAFSGAKVLIVQVAYWHLLQYWHFSFIMAICVVTAGF